MVKLAKWTRLIQLYRAHEWFRVSSRLLWLWKEQNGICPVCGQKITTLTGWHNHHLQWRSLGGSDAAYNRVLLHPHCHEQVHSQGKSVEKPRPAKGVGKA